MQPVSGANGHLKSVTETEREHESNFTTSRKLEQTDIENPPLEGISV